MALCLLVGRRYEGVDVCRCFGVPHLSARLTRGPAAAAVAQ